MSLSRILVLSLLTACGGTTPDGVEMPDLEPPLITEAELERDEAVGLLRSRSRLLVMLDADAGPPEVAAALEAAGEGAEIIGGFPELGVMLLRVADGADLDAARLAVGESPGVAVAIADYVMSHDALFKLPDPLAGPLLDTDGQIFDWSWGARPGGSNWWLEHVHMPSAWSWNDAIEDRGGALVSVGVVDSGVMPDHVKLAGRVLQIDQEPANPHGTGVAGVIAGRFDDQLHYNGVTPWATVTHVTSAGDVTALASLGDLLLTWSRQLLRHADVRVLNLSAGFNWFENQSPVRDPVTGQVVWAPTPVTDRPEQQRVVELQGEIAARHLDYLARLDRPVFFVTSAGNDGLDPAEISPTISAADRPAAEGWELPDARWNNPYCHAAIVRALENVYCVEASAKVSDWSVTRASFSGSGGTLSAPGADMGLLTSCTGAGCSSQAAGFKHGNGTSFAAPLVSGILAHMLAFAPDTTAQELRAAVMGNLRSGTGGAAGGVDAFAAMLALDGAPAALMDVDDGTPQGVDVAELFDARGDGKVDMADFRRVRDALLWDAGLRDYLFAGLGTDKRDHNRDGRLADATPEVLSRFDFNGDADLTAADLAALGGEAWQDPDVPGSALSGLELSGDLTIDATALWEAGITEVSLSAAGTPYSLRISASQSAPLFTVRGGTIELTGAVAAGPQGLGVKPITLTLEPGEDATAVLLPDCAEYEPQPSSASSAVYRQEYDADTETWFTYVYYRFQAVPNVTSFDMVVDRNGEFPVGLFDGTRRLTPWRGLSGSRPYTYLTKADVQDDMTFLWSEIGAGLADDDLIYVTMDTFGPIHFDGGDSLPDWEAWHTEAMRRYAAATVEFVPVCEE
jgi:hypothetical protein